MPRLVRRWCSRRAGLTGLVLSAWGGAGRRGGPRSRLVQSRGL